MQVAVNMRHMGWLCVCLYRFRQFWLVFVLRITHEVDHILGDKDPVTLPLAVVRHPLHRPAQAMKQLERFHTRDLRTSTITETTAAFTNQYKRHADQPHPKGENYWLW
jgi:hypothetical protein